MGNEKIDKLADKAIADMKDVAEIKDGMTAVKTAWGAETNVIKKAFAAVSAAVALITDIITYVERIGVDISLAGVEKRDLAVMVINKLVDIPWVPENVEAVLIGFTVDAIVGAFNKKFGHGWLTK